MVEIKWLVISVLIIITLGSVTLYLQPQEFQIVLNDGEIKAKYSEGILKVYSGRYIAFEDYLNIYYWNGTGYITMYKARGDKYSNLSYYKDGETTFVKQTIYYSKGNLTRFFEISEYKIKESFEWKPNDENLRVYFLWTYGKLDEWEEKYVYLDKNKKENSAVMDFEIVNNWENDLENIVRIERFQNGRLKIRTKVFQGNASFDPAIILDEKKELNDSISKYTISDVKVGNYNAKKIMFPELIKSISIKDEAEKKGIIAKDYFKLEKTKYFGDAKVFLKSYQNVTRERVKETYNCNCKNETIWFIDNKTFENVSKVIETCETCRIYENYTVSELIEVNPETFKIDKNTEIFEVFEGCSKIEKLDNGKWGCSVETIIYILGVEIK